MPACAAFGSDSRRLAGNAFAAPDSTALAAPDGTAFGSGSRRLAGNVLAAPVPQSFLASIKHYASKNAVPIMLDETADFLCAWIRDHHVKTILEIGTAIGYSAIRFAGVSRDVRVTTVEIDPERYARAVENVKAGGLASQIHLVHGDALRFAPGGFCGAEAGAAFAGLSGGQVGTALAGGRTEPSMRAFHEVCASCGYDLIFIDAAKAQYMRFFERFAPFLAPGGVIVSDNLFFHGMVEEPALTESYSTKKLVRKIRKYVSFFKAHPAFSTTFYPLGDGIAVTRARPAAPALTFERVRLPAACTAGAALVGVSGRLDGTSLAGAGTTSAGVPADSAVRELCALLAPVCPPATIQRNLSRGHRYFVARAAESAGVPLVGAPHDTQPVAPLVGAVGFYKENNALVLTALYVAPGERGKNYARALLDVARQNAAQVGVHRIVARPASAAESAEGATSASTATACKAALLKMGFFEVPTIREVPAHRGVAEAFAQDAPATAAQTAPRVQIAPTLEFWL